MPFTPSQVQLSITPRPIWPGQPGTSILIYNPDATNTAYLGGVSGISVGASNTLPLGPGQSVSVDGSQAIYACAPTGTTAAVVIPGGAAFFLGLTQAQGRLAIAAISSPNFNLANPAASPANSWALLQSGVAYVFGLVLSGGTITGPDYVINTSGAFFYAGAPAAGNLSASIVPGAAHVTDQFGNFAIAGLTSYDPATVTATKVGSQGILCFSAPTQAGPYGSAYAFADFNLSGEISLLNTLGGFSLSATTGISISAGALGVTLAGPVTATGGTAASKTQVSTDTWQAVTVNGTGWGGSGRVKLLAEAKAAWCQMNLTAGTLTNGTPVASVPAAYIPSATQFLPVGTGAGTALTNGPYLQLTTGGNWQVENLPTGTTTVHLNGVYALD